MDGTFHIDDANEAISVLLSSDAMGLAEKVLGGRKVWRGEVRGLVGFLRRGFDIQSTGRLDRNGLVFDEKLLFDDGEVQKRSWRIKEGVDGLALEADSVSLVRPGQIKKKYALEFVYRLKFGALTFRYRDSFYLRPDGSVDNEGIASWFGLPLMNITATGKAA